MSEIHTGRDSKGHEDHQCTDGTHTHTLLYPWKVDHNVEQTRVDVTVGLAVAHDCVPFERITRVSARVGSEGREVQLN